MVKNDLLNLLVPAKINMNLKTAMSPPPNTHTHAAAAVHAGSIISSRQGAFLSCASVLAWLIFSCCLSAGEQSSLGIYCELG